MLKIAIFIRDNVMHMTYVKKIIKNLLSSIGGVAATMLDGLASSSRQIGLGMHFDKIKCRK